MKGAISKKGYLKSSPDRKNDFNIVPSNKITMKGVDQPLKLIPIKFPEGTAGKPIKALPGKEYSFPDYNMVFEMPMKEYGGSPYPQAGQVPVMPHYNTSPLQAYYGIMQSGGSPYPIPGQLPVMNGYDASARDALSFYDQGGEGPCIPCILQELQEMQQGGTAPQYTFDQYYKDLDSWQNPSAQSVPKNIANYESTWIVPTIKTYQQTLNSALATKYKLALGTAPAQNQFLTAQEAQGALGGSQQYGDYLNYVQGYQAYRGKTSGTYQAPSQTSGSADPNGEAYGYRHFGLFNLSAEQQQANQQMVQKPIMQAGGPIVVNSKDDPRYKAYIDSLNYSKKTDSWLSGKSQVATMSTSSYINGPGANSRDFYNAKANKPIYFSASKTGNETQYTPVYKKPVQEVVYRGAIGAAQPGKISKPAISQQLPKKAINKQKPSPEQEARKLKPEEAKLTTQEVVDPGIEARPYTSPPAEYAVQPTNFGQTYYYQFDNTAKQWHQISDTLYNSGTQNGKVNTQILPIEKQGGPINYMQQGGTFIPTSDQTYNDSLRLFEDAQYNWELAKTTADSIINYGNYTVFYNSKLDKLPFKPIKTSNKAISKRYADNSADVEKLINKKGHTTLKHGSKEFPLYKKPVGSKATNTKYYGINITNGMPSSIVPQLEQVPVFDPGLDGLPAPTPPPPRPPGPTYQPKDGHPLYNPNGTPIMTKGRAPLPAYLQGPGTTQAQRSAWWVANGYGPDGTGAVPVPADNSTMRATFRDGGNFIQKASENMEKKGTEGAFTNYCGGKVTEECIKRGLASSNPTTRKRAAFAKTMRKIAQKKSGGDVPVQYEGLGYLERHNADFINHIAQNFSTHVADEEVDSMEDLHKKVFQMGGANMPFGSIYPEITTDPLQNEIQLAPNPVWNIPDPGIQVPGQYPPPVMMDQNQLENRPVTSAMEPNSKKNWYMSTMPVQRANGLLAGTAGIAGMLEAAQRRKQDDLMRSRMGADNAFTPVPGNRGSRGDYDANTGMFRPDMMMPTQFMGAAPVGYGYPTYKSGGEYYMTEQDIAQILADGGEIEYID